ncbi:hypothetical protein [Thalassobacillus sp. C254]|uniref:hypothetical protein n=1 Tax=Thalassobacillus sp. C254 TaxID=1225341 RepID=UPI0006D271F2|nr:hypothetical protein [Thalassobacillus sp. C254]
MLYVNFVKGQHDKLPTHERIPFEKAVALSHDLEMEMREKKQTLASYFYVIDDELPDSLYEGEFIFGSYAAPNLFIHITNNLPSIKTSKEHEKLRLSFIADMEEVVGDIYKVKEDPQLDTYKDLDQSKISRLNRWQRRTIYGVAGFFTLATFGVFTFFFFQIASANQEYQTMASETEERSQVIEYYEQALLGETEELEAYYAGRERDDLSSGETSIYAGFAASNDDFDTLNELFDQDTSLVATFLSQKQDTETLRAYDDQYPTNEARFDLAYVDEEYERLLQIENVEMNNDRSEKRIEAFLETGDIEGAREELEQHPSEEVEEKVNRYEELHDQLDDLNEQLESVDEDEEEERESLEEERENIQAEIEEL